MNFNRDINSIQFCVYMHTSPNGKRYIGITSRPVSERWGRSGNGYKDNLHFWSAIQKYGWDNFKHEILQNNLSLEEASSAEMYYISKYNTINSNFGYNHTTGGNWSSPSDEVRQVLREKSSNRSPEINKRISESLKGHVVSDETRKKISTSKIGKSIKQPSISECRKAQLSNQLRKYYKTHDIWCKGKTMETDERLLKISEKLTGRHVSDGTKQLLRDIWRRKFADGYKAVWVNNGCQELLIQEIDVDTFIQSGYTLGRLNVKNTYMFKAEKCIKIKDCDVELYLQNGWQIGRDPVTLQNVKSSRQQYWWIYDNVKYSSADDLANYLRCNGYPKIVGSTITQMFRSGTSKYYPELLNSIQREKVLR